MTTMNGPLPAAMLMRKGMTKKIMAINIRFNPLAINDRLAKFSKTKNSKKICLPPKTHFQAKKPFSKKQHRWTKTVSRSNSISLIRTLSSKRRFWNSCQSISGKLIRSYQWKSDLECRPPLKLQVALPALPMPLFEEIVGKDMWEQHWANCQALHDLMQKSQKHSDKLKSIIKNTLSEENRDKKFPTE